jgi:hypothetical protein
MKLRAIGVRRFLQISSGLIILGLLVEIVSLLWFHPLSFVLYVFVGVILIGLGTLVYLASLVFAVSPVRRESPMKLEDGELPSRVAGIRVGCRVAREPKPDYFHGPESAG